MANMLRPLVAVDLNSRIDYLTLYKFMEGLLRKFKVVDTVFIMDDKSLVEIDENKVFRVSDSYSFVEVVRNLKEISEKKGTLDLKSLIRLQKELGRSIVVLVSNRKAKPLGNMLIVFDGKKVKALAGN